MRRWLGLLAVGMLCVAGVVGCGRSPVTTTTTVSLNQTVAAMRAAATSRITTTYQFTSGQIGTQTSRATGAYNFVTHTGSFESSGTTASASASGSSSSHRLSGSSSEEIVVGSTTYSPLPSFSLAPVPAGKRWLSFTTPTTKGAYSAIGSLLTPTDAAEPGQVLVDLEPITTSVTPDGSSTIDGVAVTKYDVVVRAYEGGCGTQFGPAHPIEVWIDAQNRARQVRVQNQLDVPTSSATPAEQFSLTATMDYSDFGTSVKVQPPPASQVETFQQYEHQLDQTNGHGASVNITMTSC